MKNAYDNEPPVVTDVTMRQLLRERTARKAAETLLERKSQELYETNQDLRALNVTLEENETRYRKLVELLPDAIWVHTNEQFVFLNAAAVRLFGAESKEALLGMSVFSRVSQEYNTLLDSGLRQADQHTQDVPPVTLSVKKLDGSLVTVEVTGTVIQFKNATSVMVVAHDITERERQEAAIKHQATHDFLTGLPNRILFRDRLANAIKHTKRHGGNLAVMFVDLDRFKYINDSLGHNIGDQVLCIVAERLRDCIRDTDTVARINEVTDHTHNTVGYVPDTVARLGGDEFVFLLDNPGGHTSLEGIAQRVTERLTAPIRVGDQEHRVTCSLGISMFPQNGRDADTLLQQADIAMFRAKETGRNTYQFFTHEMQDRLDARISLEQHLQHALEHDEFVLHFQPQVALHNGQIIGLEALIRWQSPDLGMVPPSRFIPMAEESSLILEIGEWVLHEVCAQIKRWQKNGTPVLPVAINVAASQFAHHGIDRFVQQVLQAHHLDANLLEFELTESLSMEDPETSIAMMQRLREIGVSLSIDDFGTGYSNLGYLKRFPVNKLKIDQSFVRSLTRNPEDRSITATVIQLGHSLGLQVIAEGVETEGQLRLLAANQCDAMQGYYFSKPLPEAEINALLQRHTQLDLTRIFNTPTDRAVLLIDDEPTVLERFKQLCANQTIKLITVRQIEDAYEVLACQPIGVVVLQQQVYIEDQLNFFTRIKQLHAHLACFLLTDCDNPIILTDAINRGIIDLSITKSWEDTQVSTVLCNALDRCKT